MLRILVRNSNFALNRRVSTGVASATESISNPKITMELFNDLKARIYGSAQAIDKIVVTTIEPNGKKKEILMNRNLSTAIDCSKHVTFSLARITALAHITYPSGTTEYESPVSRLTQPCQVEFVSFNPPDIEKAKQVNQAFWRSSSILTAAVLQECFPDLDVLPNFDKVSSLFFSVSVEDLGSELSTDNLKEITKRIVELTQTDLRFDVVQIPNSVAIEYGLNQGVQLVRLNNYVCEADGPVMYSPTQVSKYKLLGSKLKKKSAIIGGVALPHGEDISTFNWDLISKTAKQKFML